MGIEGIAGTSFSVLLSTFPSSPPNASPSRLLGFAADGLMVCPSVVQGTVHGGPDRGEGSSAPHAAENMLGRCKRKASCSVSAIRARGLRARAA
jgi:hypothetical protein